MRVLVAFESSGSTRDAFRRRGYNAWSCDLLPGRGEFPEYHLQCDYREALRQHWDMMIAHPTCTYMCGSGWHWNQVNHGRHMLSLYWFEVVRELLEADIEHIAVENPMGLISTYVRDFTQAIHPHQFGHDASKKTGLWLKKLPLLEPTEHYPPRWVCPCGTTYRKEFMVQEVCPDCGSTAALPRWGNQTDSGQNALPPGDDRWQQRSETYAGWSEAFASQWGPYVESILESQACIDVLAEINLGEGTP